MKENQIRELVNELHDIAIEYHGTQQLRERIARTVRAAIIQAGNSPVIGIDMASEPDRSVEVRYLAPPGYVMVPKVVTPEIGNAINEVGQRCTCGNCSQRLWDLLLASAPVQVDIEMLASVLRNTPLAPSDSQGTTRTRVVKHQITGSMAKDIALKLGAELNNEEADIFADGYNAAVLNAEPLSGNFPLKRSLRDGIEVIRNAGIPVDADKIQSERNAGNLDGLNIRAIAALRAAVRNQWLKSDNFADKVYWKSMHSIANEIVEAMMKNEPHQHTDTHIPSREAIIAGGVLVQCPRCHGDSYRLNFNGWTHFWCDKCANAITSEGK